MHPAGRETPPYSPCLVAAVAAAAGAASAPVSDEALLRIGRSLVRGLGRLVAIARTAASHKTVVGGRPGAQDNGATLRHERRRRRTRQRGRRRPCLCGSGFERSAVSKSRGSNGGRQAGSTPAPTSSRFVAHRVTSSIACLPSFACLRARRHLGGVRAGAKAVRAQASAAQFGERDLEMVCRRSEPSAGRGASCRHDARLAHRCGTVARASADGAPLCALPCWAPSCSSAVGSR
jgi:hypothetical protein